MHSLELQKDCLGIIFNKMKKGARKKPVYRDVSEVVTPLLLSQYYPSVHLEGIEEIARLLEENINFSEPIEEVENPRYALQKEPKYGASSRPGGEKTDEDNLRIGAYFGETGAQLEQLDQVSRGGKWNTIARTENPSKSFEQDVDVYVGKIKKTKLSESYIRDFEYKYDREQEILVNGGNVTPPFQQSKSIYFVVLLFCSLLDSVQTDILDLREAFDDISKKFYYDQNKWNHGQSALGKMIDAEQQMLTTLTLKHENWRTIKNQISETKQRIDAVTVSSAQRDRLHGEAISDDNLFVQADKNTASLGLFRAQLSEVNKQNSLRRKEDLYLELLRHEEQESKEQSNIEHLMESLLFVRKQKQELQNNLLDYAKSKSDAIAYHLIQMLVWQKQHYAMVAEIESSSGWSHLIDGMLAQCSEATLEELKQINLEELRISAQLATNQPNETNQYEENEEALVSYGITISKYEPSDPQNYIKELDGALGKAMEEYKLSKEVDEWLKREYFDKTFENRELANRRRSTTDLLDSYITQQQSFQQNDLEIFDTSHIVAHAKKEQYWLKKLYEENANITTKRIAVDVDIDILIRKILQNQSKLQEAKNKVALIAATRKQKYSKNRELSLTQVLSAKRKHLRLMRRTQEELIDQCRIELMRIAQMDDKHIDFVRNKSFNRKAKDRFIDLDEIHVTPGIVLSSKASPQIPSVLSMSSEKIHVTSGHRPLCVTMKPLK